MNQEKIKTTFTSQDRMLRQIVGRCFCGDSNRKVIRYVITRMNNGMKTFKSLDRSSKKSFMRSIIEIHDRNRRVYSLVNASKEK